MVDVLEKSRSTFEFESLREIRRKLEELVIKIIRKKVLKKSKDFRSVSRC